MSKIFQIGFNKTATTSLYWLFVNSGHSALHSSGRRARKKGHKVVSRIHPQVLIHHNILAGLPPAEGLDDFEAFFDMEYDFPRNAIKLENFKHFAAFAEAYPNAKFILNLRDKEAWLRSRARHQDGDYLSRSMVRLGMDEAQTLQYWADDFDRHHDAVREYFLTQQGRLMEFKLEEDPIDELVDFCQPKFDIDPDNWGAARVTDTVAEKKGWAA